MQIILVLHMIFLPTHKRRQTGLQCRHVSGVIDYYDFVPHIFLLPTYDTYPFNFFNTFFAISSVSHIHLMLQFIFLFHVLLCYKAPLFYLLSPILQSSLRRLSEADYQWYQKFHKFFKAEYCICNQGDINAGKESSQ